MNTVSKPLIDIMKLNQERYGTTFDFDEALDKLKEELQEFIDASETQDEHGQVDALCSIITTTAKNITLLRYNPELALKQHVRFIIDNTNKPDFRVCKLKNTNT